MPSAAHNAIIAQSAGTSTSGGSSAYSDSNLPWTLESGESLLDDFPSALTLVQYTDARWYSSSNTFQQNVKAAADYNGSTNIVIQIPAGTYVISDWESGSSAAGYGMFNPSVMGLVGAGPSQTFIQVSSTLVTAANAADIGTGDQGYGCALRIGQGGSSTAPCFVSGITFQGRKQRTTSYVHDPNDARTVEVSGTGYTAYGGLKLYAWTADSVLQFCRFQGFGYNLKDAPLYETGQAESYQSKGTYTVRRCEFDGRLAASIDAGRQIVSGGFMWNYETGINITNTWMHYSRRSGWAMHDDSSRVGSYTADNMQVDNMNWTDDGGFYGDSHQYNFACSNLEGLGGTFTYTNCRFTRLPAGSTGSAHRNHLSLAAKTVPPGHIYINDPIILDTYYGGMLDIGGGYLWGSSNYNLSNFPATVTMNGVTLTAISPSMYNASPSSYDKTRNYILELG